jgi:hypothetical protein
MSDSDDSESDCSDRADRSDSIFGVDFNELEESLRVAQEHFREVTEPLRDPEFQQNLQDTMDRLNRARDEARTYISIGPPWEYDPSEYPVNEEAIYHSMKWAYEGADSLKRTSDVDLETFGERIHKAIDSLVDESENEEELFRTLHILLSTLDGLIIWLCETDDDREPDNSNPGGDNIYYSRTKKSALEHWYDEHDVFEIENDGGDFRDRWESFWYHRHRIMHGSPNANYDQPVAIAALFFVALTSNVVVERYNQIQRE